ncbi:MAG: M1 family aminopeptidase [Bacteroidota bacterium]
MIKIIYPFIICLVVLSGTLLKSQIIPDFETVDKIALSRQNSCVNLVKESYTTTGNEYDIKYHRLHFTVDPSVREIFGEVTTYFRINFNLVNEITFDFSDTLFVDSILFHGNTVSYTVLMDVLTIQLPVTLFQNDFDSVSVYYHGVPRYDGNRTFGHALQDTANFPVPILWTLSEPFGAKEWWPCKQNLNDKADSIDVYISAPENYRAASNGLLISENTITGIKTAFWKHRYPIAAYLVAIVVTEYSVYSDYVPRSNGDSIQVLNYVYPQDSATLWNNGKCVIDIMQLYDSLFIEYPFVNEKYGHAQFSWMGGMEHQTMSFMYNLGFELVAHELAHMWFGDYITCGSWQDIWLNEGFATYLSGLCYEHLLNGIWWPVFKNLIREKVTEFPDGSVFCNDTTDVSRIFSSRLSYRKGSALLHMLRWELGDSVFYSAVKNYLNDPALANNYAKTDNLVSHFETAGNTSLTEFFNDWFYGEGYPVYTVHWSQTSDSITNIDIYQTTTHASVDFFEMHIPLQFWHNNADTIIVFNNTQNGDHFSIYIPFIIDSIVFDPEIWLITKNPLIVQTVPEIVLEEKLIIYPIPASRLLNIYVPVKMKVEEINIFDISGKKQLLKSVNNKNQYQIDLNRLKAGVYFVEITIPEGKIRKKIVVGN